MVVPVIKYKMFVGGGGGRGEEGRAGGESYKWYDKSAFKAYERISFIFSHEKAKP